MAIEKSTIEIETRLTNAQSLTELKQVLKDARDAAIGMGAGSAEYNKFVSIAGQAKDQILTMNKAVLALNPEAKAQAFQTLGHTIVGGFQAANGALAVFSGGNTELNNILLKSTAIIGALQGIQAISDARKQIANLSIVLGLKKEAAGQLEVAAATTASEAATGKLSVATKVWNAITAVNPWFILIGILVAAAGVVAALSIASDVHTEAIKKQNERLKEDYDLQQKVNDLNKAAADEELRLAEAMGVGIDVITQKKQAISDLEIQQANSDKASLEKQISNAKVLEEKAIKSYAWWQGVVNAIGAGNSGIGMLFGPSDKEIRETKKNTAELQNQLDLKTQAIKKALDDQKIAQKAYHDAVVQLEIDRYGREAKLEAARGQDSYQADLKALELKRQNLKAQLKAQEDAGVQELSNNKELSDERKKQQENDIRNANIDASSALRNMTNPKTGDYTGLEAATLAELEAQKKLVDDNFKKKTSTEDNYLRSYLKETNYTYAQLVQAIAIYKELDNKIKEIKNTGQTTTSKTTTVDPTLTNQIEGVNNEIQLLTINHNHRLQDLELQAQLAKDELIQNEYEKRRTILTDQYNSDIKNAQFNDAQRLTLQLKYTRDYNKINQDEYNANLQQDIKINQLKDEQIVDAFDKRRSILAHQHTLDVSSNEKNYQEELISLETYLETKKQLELKYSFDVADIEKDREEDKLNKTNEVNKVNISLIGNDFDKRKQLLKQQYKEQQEAVKDNYALLFALDKQYHDELSKLEKAEQLDKIANLNATAQSLISISQSVGQSQSDLSSAQYEYDSATRENQRQKELEKVAGDKAATAAINKKYDQAATKAQYENDVKQYENKKQMAKLQLAVDEARAIGGVIAGAFEFSANPFLAIATMTAGIAAVIAGIATASSVLDAPPPVESYTANIPDQSSLNSSNAFGTRNGQFGQGYEDNRTILKAYVVSGEMTDQQNIDRLIALRASH